MACKTCPVRPARLNPVSMIGYLARSIRQLGDPRLSSVMLFGVLGALVIFAGLWAITWWVLTTIDPASVWGLGTLVGWFGDAFDWVAGIAFIGALLMVTFLMFPAVVTIVVGFFLDRVAEAVEARHYPDAGAARRQPLIEVLGTTIKFAAITVMLNLLILPIYLILSFLPPFNIVLYYLVNGYLVGREYFELAAFRRLPPGQAARLRRRFRARVLFAGVILVFFMTIPIVNLVAPVLGVAFMIHVSRDLMRRWPAAANSEDTGA